MCRKLKKLKIVFKLHAIFKNFLTFLKIFTSESSFVNISCSISYLLFKFVFQFLTEFC